MIQLSIIIIGGGVSGLATAFCLGRAGHKVTVLERNSNITEIGAGIQIGPNMSRLLIRWGLEKKLAHVGVKPEFLTFHRYENGEQIGFSWFGERMSSNHGAPYYHVHRADLIKMLYDLASPFMTLKLGCRVISVHPSSRCVQIEGGRNIYGDLIIGADGFRGVTREAIAPQQSLNIVGDVAYRVILPVDLLFEDKELRELVNIPHVRCWMGPERHVVAYLVSGGKEYNIVLIAPELGDVSLEGSLSWVSNGNLVELRNIYTGWDSHIQKLLRLASSCLKTRITYSEPLPNWTDPSMRVTLVGDACHPMLPYRAQAAAMGVEDAATLGILFSRIASTTEIPKLLRAYEELRSPRVASTLQASLMNRHIFHLNDGKEQQRRDQSMRESMEDALRQEVSSEHIGNANLWADKQKNQEQFDYDAEVVADDWFKEAKAKL